MVRDRVLTAIFSILIGTPLLAQSLADVAKKEEERRRHVKTGKVYTNTDLAPTKAAPAGDSTPSTAGDAAAPKDGSDAKPADNDAKAGDKKSDEQGEVYWSKRMASLREALQRDQVYADALQSRINALTTDFVNRDDPAQRGVVERDRQRALSELDRLKKQVLDDRKAISDIEEEARRAGVPPGWLR